MRRTTSWLLITGLLIVSNLSAQVPQAVGDRPSSGVRPPEILHSIDPEYTRAARKAKLEGTVFLLCLVNEHGDVAEAKVTRGLGKGLDENAIAAAKQWKFSPATKDGKPIPVHVALEINFHLHKQH